MGSLIFQGFYDDSENREPGDSPDLRLLACMGSSTCESQPEAQTVADFTVLDELDGTGYARADLAGVVIAVDTGEDPIELQVDFDDDADGWGATVAPGSDDVLGTLLIRWTGTLNGSIPWAWTTEGAASPGGGTYGWRVPTGGFLYERQG